MLLTAHEPFDGEGVLRFLAARAVDGVEEVVGGTYRRTLALAHGGAIVSCTPCARGVDTALDLDDDRDEAEALARVRALFGLDADPAPRAAVLGADPALAPLVARRPGLRVPGTTDGFEVAVRAVLGQQISVAAARRLAERIAAAIGEPLATPSGGLVRRFPTPAALQRAARPGRRRPAARAPRRRRRAPGAARDRPVDGGLRRAAPGRSRRLPRRGRGGAPGLGKAWPFRPERPILAPVAQLSGAVLVGGSHRRRYVVG
jgi:AraC family transcriptional regulator of adaptative response / DNA-3-methyladenine glycosylase II